MYPPAERESLSYKLAARPIYLRVLDLFSVSALFIVSSLVVALYSGAYRLMSNTSVTWFRCARSSRGGAFSTAACRPQGNNVDELNPASQQSRSALWDSAACRRAAMAAR
jgi:hypothetical protein